MTFDPTHYGPAVAAILGDGSRLADLGPGTPNEAMRPKLTALTGLPPACMAGLWLYHDFLDESHSISQDIHTPTGSFWHAIMHRREPDAWNSKYWFHQLGSHASLELLRTECAVIGYKFTNASAFVDLCERVRGTGTADEKLARMVQALEWRILFEYSFRSTDE